LARVLRLLNVVTLDVGNRPKIARILPEWVARVFARSWTFEVLLARVFLRNPDAV
jgi:hypothetical protein